MQVFVEPPLNRWQVNPDHASDVDRQALIGCLAANARRLGLAEPLVNRPMIAAGHQAWLWHPGILAKDLAVIAAAKRLDAGAFHVVVDQDVNQIFQLALPVVQGKRLSVETVELGPSQDNVATGFQPAVGPGIIRHNLSSARGRLGAALAVDIGPLLEAFADPPECRSLAEQVAVALDRLRRMITGGSMPVLFASQLPALPGYQWVLDQIRHDARRCVTSYNQAVKDSPTSGIALLYVDPHRVELPLWALIWGKPRERVFMDLSGQQPVMILESGKPIGPIVDAIDRDPPPDDRYTLGPRALLMTAVLRYWYCDLFVHGHGGGIYDRVTEDWWGRWLGKTLAPMAVVSADLTQDFDVPVADTAELRRAVWWAQHVKHNVDRVAGIDSLDHQAVNRKRYLIDHMDDDRDRSRRAAAFDEIHQINQHLMVAYPELLSQAQDRLAQARVGVANRAVATKRDWCFALYDRNNLRALATTIANP